MALLVRKIAELNEINRVLRGGIIAGRSVKDGAYGLDGLTLVFTAPAATVTFATTPSSAQIKLSAKDIVDQVNAAIGAGFAKLYEGKLAVADPAGATAVVLSNTSTALAAFGFDPVGASGVVYAAPGGAAPALVSVGPDSLSGATYVLVTEEA